MRIKINWCYNSFLVLRQCCILVSSPLPLELHLMPTYIQEFNDELTSALDNLKSTFEDFGFETVDGLSASDLGELEGFEKLATYGDSKKYCDFKRFKDRIAASLFSEQDTPIRDFDWDTVEIEFDSSLLAYTKYKEAHENISQELTGDQTVESVTLFEESEIKDKLLAYAIENDMVYEVMLGGESHYLIQDRLKKEL